MADSPQNYKPLWVITIVSGALLLFESVVGWVVGKMLEALHPSLVTFLSEYWTQGVGIACIMLGFYMLRRRPVQPVNNDFIKTLERLTKECNVALQEQSESKLIELNLDLHANFLELKKYGVKTQKILELSHEGGRPTAQQSYLLGNFLKHAIPYLKTNNFKQINLEQKKWIDYSVGQIRKKAIESDDT